MSTENATTSQKISELEEKKDIEGLKQIQEEAEMVFDGEIAGLAEKAINRLNEKVEAVEKTNESQISQVNELGGSKESLESKTEEVDQKIEEVKTEAMSQIEEVKNQNSEEKNETATPIAEKEAETQNIETQTEEKTVEDKKEGKLTESIQEKNSEIKNEIDIETVKLNSKYSEILDKEKPIIEKISELGKRDNELRAERRTLEGTGNDKRLEEIKEGLEKNEQEGKKLKWGEKVYELVQQRNEINNKKSLIEKEKYDYWKEQAKYEDKVKRLKDLDEESKKISEILSSINNDENGLDGLNKEKGKLRMEFNKKYGYDEEFAEEAKKKLGLGVGQGDAERTALNNYLEVDLPIFSKEFKLKDIGEGRFGGKYDVSWDNSSEGNYNKKLLAEKQLALWEKVKKANEDISSLSQEEKIKLADENKLVFASLKRMNNSDLNQKPYEENISDIYTPFVNGKVLRLDSQEDKNLFPDKGVKIGNEILTPYDFANKMRYSSNEMMNVLILSKLANEKGLIKKENIIDNKNEGEKNIKNLLNIIGNNVFNESIDYSKGVEQKTYPDEPDKTFFNLSLKQENIEKVKNFLESNKINDYQWLGRDKIQIWVKDGVQSPFK